VITPRPFGEISSARVDLVRRDPLAGERRHARRSPVTAARRGTITPPTPIVASVRKPRGRKVSRCCSFAAARPRRTAARRWGGGGGGGRERGGGGGVSPSARARAPSRRGRANGRVANPEDAEDDRQHPPIMTARPVITRPTRMQAMPSEKPTGQRLWPGAAGVSSGSSLTRRSPSRDSTVAGIPVNDATAASMFGPGPQFCTSGRKMRREAELGPASVDPRADLGLISISWRPLPGDPRQGPSRSHRSRSCRP